MWKTHTGLGWQIYHGLWLVWFAGCRTKVKTDSHNFSIYCFLTAAMATWTHLILSFARALPALFLCKIYGDGDIGLVLCKLWMNWIHIWDMLSSYPHAFSSYVEPELILCSVMFTEKEVITVCSQWSHCEEVSKCAEPQWRVRHCRISKAKCIIFSGAPCRDVCESGAIAPVTLSALDWGWSVVSFTRRPLCPQGNVHC